MNPSRIAALLSLFLLLILTPCAFAQTADFEHPNDRPQPTPYFQQHVYYNLNATLETERTTAHLVGEGTLRYTNNSPDTLREVYFHLYWNLFKSGSYGEHAQNRDHSDDDSYGTEGVALTSFGEQLASGNQDDFASIELDNTIMHLRLHEPILPGASRTFTFSWTGELPYFGIRSTWGYHDRGARSFATAQWYPQICVYDRHGWHPDQYIGMGEFYSEYGMYDVSLHLPHFLTTCVSTGYQTNTEMLNAHVLGQLQFARSHPDSIVRIADHSQDERSDDTIKQLWRFHADSVRDFAFCADDGFIWDAIYHNGIMHHALYWDYSRGMWEREGARLVEHTISFDSKLAGQYLYPNIFVCETFEGGMEYPGIVFIGDYKGDGRDHDAQQTIMHEIGHQWYPMMMGSNETDYGYMDEGFNTYITTRCQEDYYGRYNNSYDPGGQYNDDERTSNYRWAWSVERTSEAEPPETKADAFLNYTTYADATYGRTNNIMFMLEYTMGEPAFRELLLEYYGRWRFGHPYPEDFRDVAERVHRRMGDTARVKALGDLRWFFDEWFRKTWKLDYALSSLTTKGDSARVTIERNERAVMPVDIVFTLADGSKERRWSPVDDWLRTVASRRTYTFGFSLPVVSAVINPTNELFETTKLNNFSGWLPPMDVSLVPKITGDRKPIDAYAIRSAPFYESRTIGWTFLGSYLERSDRIAIGPRITLPENGGAIGGGVVQYHTPLDILSQKTSIDLGLARVMNTSLGEARFATRFERTGGGAPMHNFELGYTWSSIDERAPLNRLEFGYSFFTRFDGGSTYSLAIDAEAGLGDPRTTYSKLELATNTTLELGAEWNAYLRFFAGSMQPLNSELPASALFRFGSPSRAQEFEDVFLSNFGTETGVKLRNAAQSGPLVRGYQLDQNLNGRAATSVSAEIGNSSLWPFGVLRSVPVLGWFFQYTGFKLFGDAGLVTDRFCTCRLQDELAIDAGPGLVLLDRGYFSRTLGIDLDRTEFQFDFPIYESAPLTGTKWAFRYMLFVRQNF